MRRIKSIRTERYVSIRSNHNPLVGLLALAFILLSFSHSFAGTVNYIYDEANRLICEDGDTATIEYVYDEVGNMTEKRVSDAMVNPSSYDFGNVNIGSNVAGQTITITNRCAATLVISAFALTGADSSHFSIVNNTCTGMSLPLSGSCTFQPSFSPSTVGAKTASVSITFGAPFNVTRSVALTGTGVTPIISASPTSHDFGNVIAGATSAPLSVTISNSGTGNLVLGTISLSGNNAADWQIVSPNACDGQPIAPQGNCAFQVVFAPVTGGSKSATLNIPSNDPSSPTYVSLSGNGLTPQISVSPASLNFGSRNIGTTSSSQTVTISNTGGANLLISSVSISGTNSAEFSKVADTCSTVAPQASCTVSVTFSPTAGGVRSAQLNISSNDPASPKTVPLTGTGIYSYVRIVRTPPKYFSKLQDAYDDVLDGETIQSQSSQTITFVENLDVNKQVTVRLEGGYNSDFSAVTGQTIVHGQIHTISGKITIINLKTQK